MEAGKASILCSCEPMVVMLFGVLLFGEVSTVLSLAGLCVTLVALGVLSLYKDNLSEFWVIIVSNASNEFWKINSIKNEEKLVWEKDITGAMPKNGV